MDTDISNKFKAIAHMEPATFNIGVVTPEAMELEWERNVEEDREPDDFDQYERPSREQFKVDALLAMIDELKQRFEAPFDTVDEDLFMAALTDAYFSS